MTIKTGIIVTESVKCVRLVECEHAVYDEKDSGEDNTKQRRDDG